MQRERKAAKAKMQRSLEGSDSDLPSGAFQRDSCVEHSCSYLADRHALVDPDRHPRVDARAARAASTTGAREVVDAAGTVEAGAQHDAEPQHRRVEAGGRKWHGRRARKLTGRRGDGTDSEKAAFVAEQARLILGAWVGRVEPRDPRGVATPVAAHRHHPLEERPRHERELRRVALDIHRHLAVTLRQRRTHARELAGDMVHREGDLDTKGRIRVDRVAHARPVRPRWQRVRARRATPVVARAPIRTVRVGLVSVPSPPVGRALVRHAAVQCRGQRETVGLDQIHLRAREAIVAGRVAVRIGAGSARTFGVDCRHRRQVEGPDAVAADAAHIEGEADGAAEQPVLGILVRLSTLARQVDARRVECRVPQRDPVGRRRDRAITEARDARHKPRRACAVIDGAHAACDAAIAPRLVDTSVVAHVHRWQLWHVRHCRLEAPRHELAELEVAAVERDKADLREVLHERLSTRAREQLWRCASRWLNARAAGRVHERLAACTNGAAAAWSSVLSMSEAKRAPAVPCAQAPRR
mmetsp:Transcript_26981/g.72411  ORF Transcript_26981/g.72411 Transcript_26981/m.72411 type:complete len:527 (-) Transcript_26981:258-1838(-)